MLSVPFVSVVAVAAGIVGAFCEYLVFSEQEGNAPDARESDYGIYDSADNGVLSAEQPRDYVKLKQPYRAPVDCAYNDKNQWYSVKHYNSTPYSSLAYSIAEEKYFMRIELRIILMYNL